METHVHGFGPAWGNGVVYDSQRRGVVGLHWRGRLWVSHCDECMAGGDGLPAVDVEGTEFYLGSG